MSILQMLFGVAGLPTVQTFVGAFTFGQYYYETPDPPIETQTLIGLGDVFGPFGSLTPKALDRFTIDSFYYESSNVTGSTAEALNLSKSGVGSTDTVYPTLDDYPMVNGGIVSFVDCASLRVKVARHLLFTKFGGVGGGANLRFAIRTDIIEATGAGSVTVPTGATRAVIYALGGGGGGARVASGGTRRGGGNGAIVKSDIVVSSGQWGTSLSYSVGVGGTGRVSTAGNGTAGGATTVTHAGLSVSISAGGGGGATTTANGTGGTASGGNVSNTNGSAGNSITGFNPVQDAAFDNAHQGGQGGVAANGANGLAGLVAIVWY